MFVVTEDSIYEVQLWNMEFLLKDIKEASTYSGDVLAYVFGSKGKTVLRLSRSPDFRGGDWDRTQVILETAPIVAISDSLAG